MHDSPSHRLTVVYEGHVQGVGFRWTAARAARRAGVTGWVRNESDGSVRLVAEGASEPLDRLLQIIRDEMGGNIRSERIDRAAATGEFDSFEIRQ